MNINQIFETLASDNSRLFKIAELKKHQDNELLKRVIFLALDPFTQFYIRKIPEYTPTQAPEEVSHSLSMALENLDSLSSRKVTGNAAIALLKGTLESVNPDDAKVIERIIKKDLKCGASEGTVNTVWPGLIHEYPCMLASGYEEKLVNKIQYPAIAQLKSDGMRFNAIVKGDTVEFRSRNGKEILITEPGIIAEFVKLSKSFGVDMVFDGELLVMDEFDYQYMNRQGGNGILNKAVKGTISNEESKRIRATIWDAIPLVAFKEELYRIPYNERFEILKDAIDESHTIFVKLTPSQAVVSLEEAQEIFQQYLADGQEGIILKSADGIWENKRSKKQIKFKGELECDLVITGIEEGTGKYKGLLGALICESSDGIVQVRVGSGLIDEQRKSLFSSEIIGKIVAIKYNARIKNVKGEESLFLPIFLEVREDKDEADSSKDIK